MLFGDILLLTRLTVLLVLLVTFLLRVLLLDLWSVLRRLNLTVEGLRISVMGMLHLLVHQVWWNLTVTWIAITVVLGSVGDGLRSHVLVGVEATESHDVSQTGELEERSLRS